MNDTTSTQTTESGSFFSIFSILVQKRKEIIKFVLIFTIVMTAASFLISNKYTATGIILPDVDILNAAQKFGSIQDLATAAGLNLGITSPSQLYPDIIASETILSKVIYHQYQTGSYDTPVNLLTFWDYDSDDSLLNYERCLKKLREKVIAVDVNRKSAIITLSVETTEPKLSADIVNRIITELDAFQRNFRKTNASEQRKFLERRLNEVRDDLTKAEDILKSFREKNRKINDSPQLLLEQDRFVRNVELNVALFVELKKQYELVKLDEVRNTSVVQVLDNARPVAEKSSPKRIFIAILAMLLSALGSALYWIVNSFFQTYPNNTAVIELTKIWKLLSADARQVRSIFQRKPTQ